MPTIGSVACAIVTMLDATMPIPTSATPMDVTLLRIWTSSCATDDISTDRAYVENKFGAAVPLTVTVRMRGAQSQYPQGSRVCKPAAARPRRST